jgi:hypothetical protein
VHPRIRKCERARWPALYPDSNDRKPAAPQPAACGIIAVNIFSTTRIFPEINRRFAKHYGCGNPTGPKQLREKQRRNPSGSPASANRRLSNGVLDLREIKRTVDRVMRLRSERGFNLINRTGQNSKRKRVEGIQMTKSKMNKSDPSVIVDLRIPGRWSHPKDLIARLPRNCHFTREALILPDGARIDLGVLPRDGQFPEIFRSVCRQPPTEEELATADGYTVSVTLSGKGGSMEAAHMIMKAGAAIVRAGGAGVFIDNSALAHGGEHWIEMTEAGGPEALSFAFVNIVQGKADIWTIGMHVLGLRDIVLRRADVEGVFEIIEVIRYLVHTDKPVGDGHVLADVNGAWFCCRSEDGDPRMIGTPAYNPHGRYRLVKLRHSTSSN